MYRILIYDYSGTRKTVGERIDCSVSGVGKTDSSWKQIKLDSYLIPHRKRDLDGLKASLHVKGKTVKIKNKT